MKARSKKVGIIGIVAIVLLIAIILVVDILCGTYASLITLYFRGGNVETNYSVSQADAYKASGDFTVKEAAEGLVMLKNDDDGVLPLEGVSKVNLFGMLTAKQIFMGTGSAGGFNWDDDSFLYLDAAFKEANIEVNPDLWNFYKEQEGNASGTAGSVTDMQGSTHSIIELPLDAEGYGEVLEGAKDYSDTAIVVVGRAGGEGSDAVMEMNPYEASGRGGMTKYNVGGDAGKHYLELMDVELELIDYVKSNYENVILLVNTPMAIELGFVDEVLDTGEMSEYNGGTAVEGAGDIDAALWIGLPGSTGNRGVVQVLTGEVSPSGRLPDTWAYEVESAPSYYNFGDFTYDISGLTGTQNETIKYVHYREGIYVGYRWYETANAENVSVTDVGNFQYNNTTYEQLGDNNTYDEGERAFGYTGGTHGNGTVIGAEQKDFDFGNYESVVQYAFGTGLSYADFDISWAEDPTFDEASNEFVFKVTVENTTSVPSKTPVEIYVEQPYTEGGIEKSKVMLAGFDKTDVVPANGSETIEIRINRDYIASYDYITEEAYVLDAGDYTFYADWGEYGSHCWACASDTSDVLTWEYNVASRIVFDEDNPRSTDKTAATNLFDDVNIGDGGYVPAEDDMSRADANMGFPQSYAENIGLELDQETYDRMNDSVYGAVLEGYDPETYSYDGGAYSDPTGVTALATGEDHGLTVNDLIGVPYDDEKWDQLISQMSFNDLQRLIGYCGWSNPSIRSIGKNGAVDMDGCHGLHDLTTGIEANCFTTTPILAASFDPDLAYEFGSTYGDECLANGVTGMYGLSMNMHRSPFGGRNFEYYSEDSLLSGFMAAAATSGLQDKGVAVYSKHYAVNDQETNRSSVHTWASEQAMREIPLRVYEILCKEATVSGSEVLSGNTGFMTGMNFIGTSHTTSHYSLCTALPRGEWGFMGRIVTDAESYNNTMSCAIRAGTDMILTPNARTFDDIEGMDNSKGYGLDKIQEAAEHRLFVNTAGISVDSGLSYAWVALPVVISVVPALGAVAIFVFMVFPAFFVKKKEA